VRSFVLGTTCKPRARFYARESLGFAPVSYAFPAFAAQINPTLDP
jgi:hypothetical protein